MRRIVLLAAVVACSVLGSLAQASITLTSNEIISDVYDYYYYGSDSEVFNGTTIPATYLGEAIVGPASTGYETSSKLTVNYSQSGAQTVLSHTINHQRTYWEDTKARTYASTYFTANSDSTYELSATYTANHPNASYVGEVSLGAEFYDITANEYLLYTYQQSRGTANEEFVLGETEGDYSNYHFGSLTGNLVSGHDYLLSWAAHLYAYEYDSGASAVGNLMLTIEDASVPEPTTFFVWSLLGLGTVVANVRRNRQA